VIGEFYIGKHYCSSHALGNKKENLVVFNLVDFCDSPNYQNKFYAKFSSYMVHGYWYALLKRGNSICNLSVGHSDQSFFIMVGHMVVIIIMFILFCDELLTMYTLE